MCKYIRYSMSIIEKAYHYKGNEISAIKCKDEIWFRGKDIAKALGYEKQFRSMSMMTISPFWRTLEGGPRSGPPLRMSKGVQSL